MRTLMLKCVVISGRAPLLKLEDLPVTLKKKSGTTSWAGSASVTLDGSLKIDAAFAGVEESPWSIDITTDCADGDDPAKIFHDDGKIPAGGGQGLSKKKDVPADPCAKHKEGGPEKKDPDGAGKTPTKKKKPKKAAAKKATAKKAAAKKAATKKVATS